MSECDGDIRYGFFWATARTAPEQARNNVGVVKGGGKGEVTSPLDGGSGGEDFPPR